MYTRVIGLMIKQKAPEFIPIWTVPNIKVIGKKINNMEKEKKPGQMELCMMEIIFLVKNMVMENLDGVMVQYTLDNS